MSSDEGWFHLHLRIVETYATTFPSRYTAPPRRPLPVPHDIVQAELVLRTG